MWQPCEVPARQLPCSDACGDGLALCSNDKLGECRVPDPPPKSCMTGCGEGEMTCHAGKWSVCEYVAGPRSCTNECSIVPGDGTQECVNNSNWGNCVGPYREEPCLSPCGNGKKICDKGHWLSCDAPQPLPPRLHAIIRDFTPETSSDFQRRGISGSIDDRGVLLPELDAEGLPVLASPGPTRTITSADSFYNWYRDVPGINLKTTRELQLVEDPSGTGLFLYENHSFFPIDGDLYGNYTDKVTGRAYQHNYHFTLMVATEFVYVGGETFSFSGDDDMWVFINRRLAIDLGGVHLTETARIDLDREASNLSISPGGRYDLRFFFAERRTTESNFSIRTSIADVGSCP